MVCYSHNIRTNSGIVIIGWDKILTAKNPQLSHLFLGLLQCRWRWYGCRCTNFLSDRRGSSWRGVSLLNRSVVINDLTYRLWDLNSTAKLRALAGDTG